MSGKVLKLIALVTMIIDHIGASLVYVLIVELGHREYASLYYLMRHVGRIAFPIYCFLLVEGFYHTKNLKRYIISMGIFALISEIPFDLALSREAFMDWSHQNVFFTMFLGLIAMYFVESSFKLFPPGDFRGYAAAVMVIAAFTGISFLMRADYKGIGVFIICLLQLLYRSYRGYFSAGIGERYFFFNIMLLAVATLCIYSKNEIYAFLGVIPFLFYNGERGRIKYKYFYYAAYPVHLLILAGICRLWLK